MMDLLSCYILCYTRESAAAFTFQLHPKNRPLVEVIFVECLPSRNGHFGNKLEGLNAAL